MSELNLPWEVTRYASVIDSYQVIDATGDIVTKSFSRDGAEQVVRAANSHEAFSELARRVLEYNGAFTGGFCAFCGRGRHKTNVDRRRKSKPERCIDNCIARLAREALALAENNRI